MNKRQNKTANDAVHKVNGNDIKCQTRTCDDPHDTGLITTL